MDGPTAPQAGTPASMRALNQRLVLDRLRDHGEATRPQIAGDTGLSKPTVGQALLDLEQHGLVRAIGRRRGPSRSGGGGLPHRSGRRVTSSASTSAGACCTSRWPIWTATVVARVEQPNRSRSGAMLVRTVEESVDRAVAEAGLADDDIVVTVLGTPGIPDTATGTVHRAPNLPGWERRGLLHELVALLGANGSEVIVENDANLCAVGEHARGAAQGVDVVACLTVGTGIGMGILVDGKLFRGAHGAAGEIADLPYGRVPAGVTAHRPGPVEVVAAGQAVVSAARDAGLNLPTAKAVFDTARDGDERALARRRGRGVQTGARRLGGDRRARPGADRARGRNRSQRRPARRPDAPRTRRRRFRWFPTSSGDTWATTPSSSARSPPRWTRRGTWCSTAASSAERS